MEDTNQSKKHPNTTPPRRAATPDDAADVDADTTAGKAFARRLVDADPTSTKKVNHRTSRKHQKREG
jgi:hypothetical protein